MDMGRREPFTEEDAKRLEAFAGQLTMAVRRKQAEEALYESEERFRYISSTISDIAYSCTSKEDGSYSIDWLMGAAERVTGYTIDEILANRSWRFLVLEEDMPLFDEYVIGLIPGKSGSCELRLRHKNGGVVWVASFAECVEKQVRGQTYLFGGLVEITERKQAEEALRAAEEKYRAIFENAMEGIFQSTIEGRFITVNPAFARMLGYASPQEMIATVTDIARQVYVEAPRRAEFVRLMAEQGSVTGFEFQMRRKDGGNLWVSENVRAVRDADGGILYYEGTVENITERKQAEEALRQSENKLRALFAAMTDAIIVFDAEGRYLEIAPTNPINLYRPPDDMLGKTVHDILPKEQADYTVAKIGEALQTGQIVTGEYALQIGGKDIWFASSASQLSENTAVWVAHDITNRKRAEEQIQRQVETLGVLYDLSRTLSGMEDFNAILDLVTRRAVEATHVTFARVLLLENGDLVARAVFPVRVLDHDLQVGQREPLAAHPLYQRILEENTPLILQVDSPEAGDCALFFLGIAQTLCIVPLCTRERPLGLLMLGEVRAAAREPFTADKMRLAWNIGDQAASTLHRALLHEETQRRLRNIQALRDIDHAIAGSLDLRLTLSIVLEQVVSQLNVDAADVLLLNPFLQSLDYTAGHGFRTPGITRSHLRLGEEFAGKAALEHRHLHIPDLTQESGFVRLPLLAGENFIGYYAVPLVAKGQVKGVLEVFHRAPLPATEEWTRFLESLSGQAAIAIDNAQLFDGLQRSNVELVLAYDSTLEGWAKALELRDEETEGHAQRVTEMTIKLARAMKMSEAELVHVRRGALLHDIGKMGVPDSILLKLGPLDDEEWKIMRCHPQYAFNMLSTIGFLNQAMDIPYCHHEKWDGSGYPRGLKGEQIPLAARIFAVVDVWDALLSDRPYRKAWSQDRTTKYIREQAGKHFDPKVVEAFFINR